MTSVAEAPTATRTTTYIGALREAIDQLLESDPSVFICGEDVGGFGSPFGTTRGLMAKYGPQRVVDTPISESGLMGMGVGSALVGLRPIVEIMFMDFLGVCMDVIVNQAAKNKYMFGGKAVVPLTIQTFGGAGGGSAAQHSQSLEAWFCHVPGMKVLMPASPYDAKGLTIAAVRDPNPVMVVHTKSLLGLQGEVPEGMYETPIGVARTVREGSNLTLVATGRMVREALTAAETLAAEGIDAEIVDPRTLQPLDIGAITSSVQKTHRCLVVHEAVRFGGIGGEIVAQVQEEAFDYLDAPIGRVGAPFSPVPAGSLEKHWMPNANTIVEEARRIVSRG
jgi:pyruvate dehydrogenase E1 component beta subunit